MIPQTDLQSELDTQDLAAAIIQLKERKNALILAHYYQEEAIQDIADLVGDSLELSRKAAETDAEIIVFSGVHFMAETAKILSPEKKVLLPDLSAGCSLADSTPTAKFKAFIEEHPNHKVVTYVNCSAEIKALSDITCTSSNALKVVDSFPKDQPIIFAPDKNLGRYVSFELNRELLLWDGACIVHEAFSIDKLLKLATQHPLAEIAAHPETEEHILKVADFIGSTSGILNYVKNHDAYEFIIATEAGILYKMQQAAPTKTLIPAPSKEDNTCACSECAFMKVNTLQKLHDCLKNETPEIFLHLDIIENASIPIHRMLELS